MEPGQEVIIRDNRTNVKLFGGYVKEVTRKFPKPDLIIQSVSTQGYEKLIVNVDTGVTADYIAGANTEKEILTALFATYCPTITVGAHVITGNLTAIAFTNSSLRRAIDELAAVEGRKWYVDADKRLHYFASTGETAPFGFSDTPDDSSTFGYADLEYTTDENGDIRGKLKCWQSGLYAGMAIGITNALLGWSAQSYMITEIQTRLISGSLSNTDIIAEYTVNFGTLPKSQISNEIIRSGRVITTARIADLAVTNAKIESCSIDKLTAGQITVQALIGTGGAIASAASGTRIQITPAEIAGYNGSTKQFYLQSSDGKAYAGAGAVVMDATGLTIKGAFLKLSDSSGNLCGALNGYTNTTRHVGLYGDQALVLSAGGATPSGSITSGVIASAGTNFDMNLMTGAVIFPIRTDAMGDPSITTGAIYYNSTTGRLRFYDAGTWHTF
jgi:hypothetical protein